MSINSYIQETREEMKHVNWPTRRQIIAYTIVVILISFAAGLYLGALDYVLHLATQFLLK